MSSEDDSNGEDDVDEVQSPPRSPSPEAPAARGAGGDVQNPNLPPLPPRSAVLERMRQVKDLYGYDSEQWDFLREWIDSKRDAYAGIYNDLAREETIMRRLRRKAGLSITKLDDPDKTDSSDVSDNPPGISRRREYSLEERKQASYELLCRTGVLNVMWGDPGRRRRLNISCPSFRQEQAKILAAKNADGSGSSGSGGNDGLPEIPFPVEAHGGIHLGKRSRSGEGSSGKTSGSSRKRTPLTPYWQSHTLSAGYRKRYKPCQFIVDRGDRERKMCGRPVPNTPQFHFCVDHTQQAAALERESKPSGEKSKPSEQRGSS